MRARKGVCPGNITGVPFRDTRRRWAFRTRRVFLPRRAWHISDHPQALAKRAPEYWAWVEGYARNHEIPMKSSEQDESQAEFVRPSEPARHVLSSFRAWRGQDLCSLPPRYPTD